MIIPGHRPRRRGWLRPGAAVPHPEVAEVVEIIHESLITRWPTLRRWLDESGEDSAFLEQLRTVSKQWDSRGRPEGSTDGPERSRSPAARNPAGEGVRGAGPGGRARGQDRCQQARRAKSELEAMSRGQLESEIKKTRHEKSRAEAARRKAVDATTEAKRLAQAEIAAKSKLQRLLNVERERVKKLEREKKKLATKLR